MVLNGDEWQKLLPSPLALVLASILAESGLGTLLVLNDCRNVHMESMSIP